MTTKTNTNCVTDVTLFLTGLLHVPISDPAVLSLFPSELPAYSAITPCLAVSGGVYFVRYTCLLIDKRLFSCRKSL